MTKRRFPRQSGYHRSVLGGGSVLKAVSRTRRRAAGHNLGALPPRVRERAMMRHILNLAERYDA